MPWQQGKPIMGKFVHKVVRGFDLWISDVPFAT